jgi:deoxyribodipyrimidine photo-lyase
MKAKRVIVWLRQDLRLHDNEAITNALNKGEEVIPVYVFDERTFNDKTAFGFRKTEKYRAQFIIDAVKNLRESFQKLGIDLVVRVGKSEEIIYQLCEETQSSWVFCNVERTDEEIKIQDKLEQNLWSSGKEMMYSRGKMLYYTQDLPFPIAQTPDVFTHFRKEVEKYISIREPLPAPTNFHYWTVRVDPGEIPSLEDLGYEPIMADDRSAFPFKGGETAALARLNYYLWETDLIKNYKETRNGLIGGDYSSKLSPWLAQGCISPKYIYHELKKYEAARGKNKSTYWLFFELLWRDFFRLMGKKHKNKIFFKSGTRDFMPENWKDDMQLFKIWSEGKTGVPFIDANMKELKETGFMSNRGRQNVASFLVKDLKVNWQIGAEYFESLLIDYDVCSNWLNWAYVAGVGSDPRENRYFNILTQAKRYDPEGAYVKRWLPELSKLPKEKIHQPDVLSIEEQKSAQLMIGTDYPQAIVSTERWVN